MFAKVNMERWSSRIGFILATIGSAVGIGNVWRFSSVVGQNGGGAYLIPYLLACFLFAVPLMVLELSAGRYFHGAVVSTFSGLGRRMNIVGWFVVGVISLILSYYLVITGWTFAYSWFSLSGTEITFSSFSSSPSPILFFILSVLITGLIVSLGVKKGIERLTTILIPFVFILLAGMAIYATTLSGYQEGMAYLFTPDFSVLFSPFIWSAALGQSFFSLSVGQGILLTYGAYTSESINIFRASLIITLADIGASILAGLVIFPVVFTFGLAPTAGAELAFTTLPRAFEVMPFGQLFGLAFFVLLFFAALTSAVSMLEVPTASVMEATRWNRRKTIGVLIAIILLVGIPSALSYSSVDFRFQGIRWLDVMDDTIGTMGLIMTAILTSVSFSWFLDAPRFREVLNGSSLVYRMIRPLARYVIPPVLVIALGFRVVRNIPAWHLLPGTPQPGIATLVLLTSVLLGTLIVSTLIACRFWGCRWNPWRR
ncbi:MAG: sodium-dependent transporter [Methanomicrobiales archaeon]|nr:sodium-dependent transporter [Methanomicrobiales archaeon]